MEYTCWHTCHTHPLTLRYLLIWSMGSHSIRHIFIIYSYVIFLLPLPWSETYLNFNGPRTLSYWTTTNVGSFCSFSNKWRVYHHIKSSILHLSFYIFSLIYSFISCIFRLYIPNITIFYIMMHPWNIIVIFYVLIIL